MIYYPLKEFENADWKGYTFLMPTVAVGNVGQLTIDLLLSTLDVQLIGRIHHPVILPLVGADPFNSVVSGIATSCQVYVCRKHKLVILQQRTPVTSSGRVLFSTLLSDWIKSQNFNLTIVVSSCFSHFLTDNELTKKLQYLHSSEINSELLSNLQKNQNLHLLQPRNSFTLKEDTEGILQMPGSGITKLFFTKLSDANLPVLILLLFCSEGDNIPDAFILADTLKNIINLHKSDEKQNSWKIPVSWTALFGNSAPKTIY